MKMCFGTLFTKSLDAISIMELNFIKFWLAIFLCVIFDVRAFAQEEYAIVAISSEDSTFCMGCCPFYDFEKRERIYGSTIPDQLVMYEKGSMEQLYYELELFLCSTVGCSPDGSPIAFYAVIDAEGIVRGIIVNRSYGENVSLSVANAAFDYLKEKRFIPAKLRGKSIPYGITLLHRVSSKKDSEMTWSYDSWPSFDNDRYQEKLNNFIQTNLFQIDTLNSTQTVYVQFEVDTLGFTFHHKVLKGVNQQLDSEALRVCRLIKFDHPAMRGGRPAKFSYLLPIKFEPKTKPIPKKKSCWLWRRR